MLNPEYENFSFPGTKASRAVELRIPLKGETTCRHCGGKIFWAKKAGSPGHRTYPVEGEPGDFRRHMCAGMAPLWK